MAIDELLAVMPANFMDRFIGLRAKHGKQNEYLRCAGGVRVHPNLRYFNATK